MSTLDELKNTFFEECSELLVQLEAGLTEMRDGSGTEDSVHSVFRAVHSIKGGAGVFGFDELIGFSHVFETTLDAVRRGSLAVTPEIVDVLFRASDTLSDLVSMAREGRAVLPGFGSESRAALDHLIGGDGESEQAAPAELEGLSFTPVRVDDFEDEAPVFRRFSIRFRPAPDMLAQGIEPSAVWDALRLLGALDLTADTSAVPPLTELNLDQTYLAWDATLAAACQTADIEAVFAAHEARGEIDIRELAPDADPVPPASVEPSAAVAADMPAAAIPLPSPQELAPTPAPTSLNRPAPAPEPAFAAAPTPQPVPAPAPLPAPIQITPSVAPPSPVSVDAPADAARAENAERAAGGPAGKGGSPTIRVELEKIDRVVNMVGELVIAQAMLGQAIEGLSEQASGRISNILADLVRHTRGLKDSVMAIRAQPVGSVFQRMPRLVRELSSKTGKAVQIEMSGESTEVDKTIIERLSDPLTHIIRNSIDHGIEPPNDRAHAGKSEAGTIHLSAEQRGGRIVIEVSDDGGGINRERVLRKARDKGLVDPNAALTDEEICNLVFLPGFSTAEAVSDISGRGVGMDVVRRNIQDLGGRTSIRSEPGRGTTIQLVLPLTLAVMDGMVIRIGCHTYVLPIPNIVECLRPGRGDIHQLLGTTGTLHLRGDVVPLVQLGGLLGVVAPAGESAECVVIITETSDGTRLGLLADELCGHQQVVIKSIEENCGNVSGIAGATILGDGQVAFILDVETISEMLCGGDMPAGAMASAPPRVAGAERHLN